MFSQLKTGTALLALSALAVTTDCGSDSGIAMGFPMDGDSSFLFSAPETGKNPAEISLMVTKLSDIKNPLDVKNPDNQRFYIMRKERVGFQKPPSYYMDKWGTTYLGKNPDFSTDPALREDVDDSTKMNEFDPESLLGDINFQTVDRRGNQMSIEYNKEAIEVLQKYIGSISHFDKETKSAFSNAPTSPGDDYECELDKKVGSQKCINTDTDNDNIIKQKRYVFGTDNRNRVNSFSDSSNWPFRAAGRVGNHCSGTLIGPGYVLTAGHCVHEGPGGTWYSNLDFKPGHSSERASPDPYGTYSWCRATTVTAWTVDGKAKSDYALITLCNNPGFYMAFGYNSGISSGWNMNINGYPGSTLWSKQYNHYGSLLSTGSKHFKYRGGLDIVKGTSGSAVYLYKSSTGSRVVYGINNWQYCYSDDAKACSDNYGSGHSSSSYNHAVRINSSRFSRFCGWMPGRC